MIVILLLIPLSIVIAVCFLVAFIWAVPSGQYEDTCTPSMRLLTEENRPTTAATSDIASEPQSDSAMLSGQSMSEEGQGVCSRVPTLPLH